MTDRRTGDGIYAMLSRAKNYKSAIYTVFTNGTVVCFATNFSIFISNYNYNRKVLHYFLTFVSGEIMSEIAIDSQLVVSLSRSIQPIKSHQVGIAVAY